MLMRYRLLFPMAVVNSLSRHLIVATTLGLSLILRTRYRCHTGFCHVQACMANASQLDPELERLLAQDHVTGRSDDVTRAADEVLFMTSHRRLQFSAVTRGQGPS